MAELDSKILEKIEKLEIKKPILLIGKDKELIRSAVGQIYYKKEGCFVIPYPEPFGSSDNLMTYFGSFGENKNRLREYNCIGKTEAEIERDLFLPKNLINYYKNGDMFFIRGLNIPRILERLADSVEKYCNGVLIVNVPSIDIVPQELSGQFEVIKLEPEKQDISASIPKNQDIITFPTPSGTQWSEVKISFIDNEYVSINIKGKTTQKHYTEMGFKGRRKCSPSELWNFFKEIAKLNGSFSKWPNKDKVKVKELFSDLRKKLTEYFKIDGDPIPHKKGKGYQTAFKLEDKSFSKEHEASIRKHNREYVSSNKHIHNDNDDLTDNDYRLNE